MSWLNKIKHCWWHVVQLDTSMARKLMIKHLYYDIKIIYSKRYVNPLLTHWRWVSFASTNLYITKTKIINNFDNTWVFSYLLKHMSIFRSLKTVLRTVLTDMKILVCHVQNQFSCMFKLSSIILCFRSTIPLSMVLVPRPVPWGGDHRCSDRCMESTHSFSHHQELCQETSHFLDWTF